MHDDESPWYRDGLRFECSQCGDCCTGDPGAVWVNRNEIQVLAEHLEMTVEAFSAMHLRTFEEGVSLKERDSGSCVFFDEQNRGCQVYAARPVQCRTWPFWPGNLRHARAWEDTQRACPGAGEGQLVTLSRIRSRLVEHQLARRISAQDPPEESGSGR